MLRSDLCDHSDMYIVVKGEIAVKVDDNANRRNRKCFIFVVHIKKLTIN